MFLSPVSFRSRAHRDQDRSESLTTRTVHRGERTSLWLVLHPRTWIISARWMTTRSSCAARSKEPGSCCPTSVRAGRASWRGGIARGTGGVGCAGETSRWRTRQLDIIQPRVIVIRIRCLRHGPRLPEVARGGGSREERTAFPPVKPAPSRQPPRNQAWDCAASGALFSSRGLP